MGALDLEVVEQADAVEALAKKRSAAAGQADSEEDGEVPDFSQDKPANVKLPFPGGLPEPDQLLDVVDPFVLVPSRQLWRR